MMSIAGRRDSDSGAASYQALIRRAATRLTARAHEGLIAAAVGALMFGLPSYSQAAGFTCPNAGTVAQYQFGRVQYQGAAQSDPYLCALVNIYGKNVPLLFNFYGARASDYSTIENALVPLFAKQIKSASFVFQSTLNNGHELTETWTFLRTEEITLSGRNISTDVLELRRQRKLGHSYDFRWTLWFDPVTGIWIKRELTAMTPLTGQGITPSEGQLVSITVP
jgi:hypothetical protein